jgi:hypothetical protein
MSPTNHTGHRRRRAALVTLLASALIAGAVLWVSSRDAAAFPYACSTAAGYSFVEECHGEREGCNREERKELHGEYREEIVNETGKVEWQLENDLGRLAWGQVNNYCSNHREYDTGVLLMLYAFRADGWNVRQQDINRFDR